METRVAKSDKELSEIKATADKMAERMNMRFVLNQGKIKDFQRAGGYVADEDSQEAACSPRDDQPILNT